MNAVRPNPRRQRRLLLLLALIFLAPVALSFYLYYGTNFGRAGDTVNNGELITPARLLPELALTTADGTSLSPSFLRGKWSLIYLGDGSCDADCRQALYLIRQIRLALNQDLDRVQRVFLYRGSCCEQPFFETEHRGLIAAQLDSAAGRSVLTAFPEAGARAAIDAGRIYLADPLGNLFMSYPPGTPPKGILEDLKRLLKLSHIG